MKPVELTVPWLPFRALAMTTFPIIWYRHGHRTRCIELHEHYHWRDQGRWGLLWLVTWLPRYVALGLSGYYRKPADQHPMEREAYRVQRQCEATVRGER